jgi:hypothetical protein
MQIILLFSAGLQITAFFSLASTGIWIDKINQRVVKRLSPHEHLYLAALVVTLVVGFSLVFNGCSMLSSSQLLVPWLILVCCHNWKCERRLTIALGMVLCSP